MLTDVSETALMTLACHALDAQAKNSILNDFAAIETLRYIQDSLPEAANKMQRSIKKEQLGRNLVIHIALRAQRYDNHIRRFCKQHDNPIIINLACGMDDRFGRIDNGKLLFFDLDLPEMIAFKKGRFPESERYKQIGQSVFDFEWMQPIPKNRPVIFLAEGLFMYCNEADIKALFMELQKQFPGCEIVFELFNNYWITSWRKPFLNVVLKYKLKFGKDAMMRFGLRKAKDIEAWSEGFELLDEWSFFDSNHKKLGAIVKLVGKVPLFRHTLWTIHYRLNKQP